MKKSKFSEGLRGIHQEIDVLGGADHFVRCERKVPDQGEGRAGRTALRATAVLRGELHGICSRRA